MSGPSDRAVEAAMSAVTDSYYRHSTGSPRLNGVGIHRAMPDALAAAHDPALGEDASVCIGDVLEAFRRFYVLDPKSASAVGAAVHWVVREHREGRLR